MSETAAILVTLHRVCDELQTATNSLRALLEIMEAHRVLDTERPTEPPHPPPLDRS